MQAVRAAARGETLLSPEVLQRVLAAKDAPSAKEENALSAREREVLAAVAMGERNKEIAARLEISERTVKARLANVFNKLGVDSRAAAVSIALRDGLVRLAPDDQRQSAGSVSHSSPTPRTASRRCRWLLAKGPTSQGRCHALVLSSLLVSSPPAQGEPPPCPSSSIS